MVSLPVIQILDPWLLTSARHYVSLLCVQLCMHGYITMDDPESSRGMNDTEDVNAVNESGGEDGVVKVIVHDPPPPSLAAGALAPLPHDPDHGSADNEVSKKRKESSATKKAVPATKNRTKDPKAPKKTMTSFTFSKPQSGPRSRTTIRTSRLAKSASSLGWPGRKYPTSRRLTGKRRRIRKKIVTRMRWMNTRCHLTTTILTTTMATTTKRGIQEGRREASTRHSMIEWMT